MNSHIHVSEHPLVKHKLTKLRDTATKPKKVPRVDS